MYQFGMHILENTKDISLIKGGAADVYSRDPLEPEHMHRAYLVIYPISRDKLNSYLDWRQRIIGG